MKRLLALCLFGSVLSIGSNSAKADENYFLNHTCSTYGGNCTYEILKSTGSGEDYTINKVTTWTRSENSNNRLINYESTFWHDANENKLFFTLLDENGNSITDNNQLEVYDISTDTWSKETINTDTDDTDPRLITIPVSRSTEISTNTSNISSNDTDISTNASNISSNDTDISALQGLISTNSGSITTARIGNSTKNTLEIGGDTNPTTINQEGISVGGSNLIKKQSNGDIHIGKNSFVIGNDVLDGAHPIWAEDEDGTKIPLNIYGSDLQINGLSVQGQIDSNKSNIKNLGSGVAGSTALTAALTALPQTSKESKASCGVGSGAYSSRYAVGFGCASKVNERVDINAGGSYVFGGSKSYGEGTLDSGVVKAGFVFKLGELNKPTQISMKDKKVMETKIQTLEEKNKQLLARLERLEKIALGESNSPDLAVYQLK